MSLPNLQLLENAEKTISKLKETRNNIFSVKDLNFGWKNYYSLSYMRKFPEIQKKIDLNETHLNLIVDNFKEWSKIPTYLMFKDLDTGDLSCALASKRGNKVYEYYLHQNLNQQLEFMKNPNFHKSILRNKKGFRNKKISNVCFLTLTCNPAKYNNSRLTAWLNFEHDYNIFITRLRKKYGECWIMKSVESTKKGYPHIHLLIITEKDLDVFPHKNKEGFTEYRLCDKKEIESYWTSFIDAIIPNPSEMKKKGCVDFMKDYIFKDMLKAYTYKAERSYENYLSLALGWLLGKRCYSISRKNLSLDLIMDTSITQTQIDDIFKKNKGKRFVFLGLSDFKPKSNKPPPICFVIPKSDENYENYLNEIYGLRREINYYHYDENLFEKEKTIFDFEFELYEKKEIRPIIKTNDVELPLVEDFECVNLKDMKVKLFTGRTLFEFKQSQKRIRRLGGLNKDNFNSEDKIKLAITGRC